jgi:hypothetical protein
MAAWIRIPGGLKRAEIKEKNADSKLGTGTVSIKKQCN